MKRARAIVFAALAAWASALDAAFIRCSGTPRLDELEQALDSVGE